MEEACLYTVLWTSKEVHDHVLREVVRPLVDELRREPELDSFFFVRYNVPKWQLRVRFLGRPGWIEVRARPALAKALSPAIAGKVVERAELGEYARELDRYGGPEGMRLAEQIFDADSMAALRLLEAEARGRLAITRREYSLVHTERMLDLLRFDRPQRIAVYRLGHSWAIEGGDWTPADVRTLDERYERLHAGLRQRLQEADQDPEAAFGGEEAYRISRECIEATRPALERVLEAHAAGRVQQDLVYLAWSYCHMHCNRLGIENPAEAILRYFMFRIHGDEPLT